MTDSRTEKSYHVIVRSICPSHAITHSIRHQYTLFVGYSLMERVMVRWVKDGEERRNEWSVLEIWNRNIGSLERSLAPWAGFPFSFLPWKDHTITERDGGTVHKPWKPSSKIRSDWCSFLSQVKIQAIVTGDRRIFTYDGTRVQRLEMPANSSDKLTRWTHLHNATNPHFSSAPLSLSIFNCVCQSESPLILFSCYQDLKRLVFFGPTPYTHLHRYTHLTSRLVCLEGVGWHWCPQLHLSRLQSG